MAQHCPSSQEYSVQIDPNTNNKQLIQTQGGYSTAPPAGLQRQLTRQKHVSPPFLTGPDDLTCTSPTFVQTPILDATHPWRTEERNDMTLEHDNPLSQYLTDFGFQGQILLPLSGNESPQAGNSQVCPWFFSPNGAADLDLHTPWPITDSSPQSPVGPSAAGHVSSQDFQFPFCGNEHLQAGNSQVPWPLLIPPSVLAGPPTSSTSTTASSAQSPAGPSAAGLHVAAEGDIRTVGSLQIQQAAARRRKKDGAYQCPLGNCNATFTEFHNLQYHLNAHLGLKPYKCTECSYAANSPTTLKRHMKRHQVIP